MTTALVSTNVPTASALRDVGLVRGSDPGESNRFAGFLERALIESEPPDARIGSSDNGSYNQEPDKARIARDESDERDVRGDREARELKNARDATDKISKDDDEAVEKSRSGDRSGESDARSEDRLSVAQREAERAAESDTRDKTSLGRTAHAKGVAAEVGEEDGSATKATKKKSNDGAVVKATEPKKNLADDDEVSRAGAAGVQKQLDRHDTHEARLGDKHRYAEAETRSEAVGTDDGRKKRTETAEADRIESRNAKKGDRVGHADALGRADVGRSDRGDRAETRKDRDDRGTKRGGDRNERVVSRDRETEPRVKVIDARRAERLDTPASGEKTAGAEESRSSSDAPGVETRNPGGHEITNARNPVRYAEASAELARSLRESANSEIVREARIILRTENSGEIRLVLRPEELGNVRIRLQMQDNHIAGRILVENSSIRDVFAQNMDDLARAFAEAGIELGSMEVSVGDGEKSDADDRPTSGGPTRVADEFERNTHAVVYYGFEDTRVNVFA